MKPRIIVIALVCILLVFGLYYFLIGTNTPTLVPTTPSPSPSKIISTVSYACELNKNILAKYEENILSASTTASEPPTPNGSVTLTFDGGRILKLLQTISADGGRYANAEESIVFWNKGKGVMITEDNNKTFTKCIEIAKTVPGLSEPYASSTGGVSLRFPSGYIVDNAYRYQALGPGKDILGVKFTISPSVATGTNLSKDSYISVEQIPNEENCRATLFLDQAKTYNITESGTSYSVASSTGAGAGNRYEETVYAVLGTYPCLAVRYFIHYTVLENYPKGTITQFDKQLILNQFDSIRRTLLIAQ